ncbi:glycosyltransferase family 4 protein [candidate division WOR-3 bacterium]|nr:glycosyltransferase family 4 protein [candidate division WOR-3 bacterium]
MKIAIVTHNTIKNDGQGIVNYKLTRYLAKKGHEVHLYTNRVEDDLRLIKNVVIHYVPVFRESPNLPKSVIFFIFATLKLIRKHYDVIHINGATCLVPHSINTCHFCHAGWQAVGIEKGFYYKFHTLINIWMEKIIYKKYKNTRIIALSEKIKNELTNIIGIDEKRIEVLYNGVDIEEFNTTKKRKSLRKSLGIEDDDFVILFLGDLRTKRKGTQYLVEAFKKINLPGIKLLLVGGSSGTHFEKVIETQNMQNSVFTLGFVKDTVSLYTSADVFVFPTLYEACSLTVFEAMASGLPVITSRQAGSSEIIEDKKDGLILKNPRDSEEIKEKIELLYNDRFLRSEIGKNAREKVKNYTWDKMNQKIEKIYKGVVANPL